jgi:hypothetical protein
MNKDLPILKNKWFEVYFGLFGPEIIYSAVNYKDEHSVLIISLIFLKLYIKLPVCDYKQEYDSCHEYGFYFTNEPVATLVLRWGNIYKSYVMPWVRVVVNRYMYNESMLESEIPPYIFNKNYEITYIERHWFKLNFPNDNIEYTITRLESSPNIFSKFKWFLKSKYLIEARVDNRTLTFNTDTLNCIQKQIEFQLDIDNYLHNNGLSTKTTLY